VALEFLLSNRGARLLKKLVIRPPVLFTLGIFGCSLSFFPYIDPINNSKGNKMARAKLTSQFVQSAVCPEGRRRIEFFDTASIGLSLEVRETGGKTYYRRYRDQRGRLRQIKLGNTQDLSLSDARKLAVKIGKQVAFGEDPLQEKTTLRSVPTFVEFIEQQYLPHAKSYKRSWMTDVSLLNNHLLPRFAKRYMDQIERQDIVKMLADRKAEGAAAGSVNRLLIMMRFIYNLALRWEVAGVKDNPTRTVALLQENNKRERYLSADEARRLYDAVCRSENKMLQYIVPMLILTGARKREVMDARWTDFDFERRHWRIPTTKLGRPRHVPLSDGVMTLLTSMSRTPQSDAVFANPKTGKPYVSFWASWNTARTMAGLEDVRVHDLRHSFASLLINSGRTLYEVQRLLGHTQIKTTQRYAHLAPETLLAASNAATQAVGSVMGVIPASVADVPLVAVGG
jgi:integrase